MSVVKINALTVPVGRRDELEARFAARAGMVDQAPGFERFQLLRPTDADGRYFVLTQWDSEESFQAWMASRAFGQGHADTTGGDRGGDRDDEQGQPGPEARRPAASDASLLAFEVVQDTIAQHGAG